MAMTKKLEAALRAGIDSLLEAEDKTMVSIPKEDYRCIHQILKRRKKLKTEELA